MKFSAEGGSTDSKNYLRLKDKDSARGVFVGDPYEFRMHWVGGRSVLCSEDANCKHCAMDLKSSFRFRINFIIKGENGYEAKIFEQGWTTYNALKELHEGDYNLENHLMKISRSGSGQHDTTYSIIPVPKGEITAEQAKALVKVPLHDLKHKEEAQVKDSPDKDPNWIPEPAFDTDSEIPF